MIARIVLITQSTFTIMQYDCICHFIFFNHHTRVDSHCHLLSMSDSSKCNATIDSYFMESFIICPSGNTYPIPILQSTTIRLCNPLTHFMHSSSSLSAFSSLLNNRIHLYIIIIHHYSILFLQPAKFIDITIHLYLSHSTDLQYPNFTYPTI